MLCTQELPSREAVREVIAVADAFWGAHPDEYIAIHCAYGAPRSTPHTSQPSQCERKEPAPSYSARRWALAG